MKTLTVNSHTQNALSISLVGSIEPMGQRTIALEDNQVEAATRELTLFKDRGDLTFEVTDGGLAPNPGREIPKEEVAPPKPRAQAQESQSQPASLAASQGDDPARTSSPRTEPSKKQSRRT